MKSVEMDGELRFSFQIHAGGCVMLLGLMGLLGLLLDGVTTMKYEAMEWKWSGMERFQYSDRTRNKTQTT